MAGEPAEGLAHVGDQRDALFAHALGGVDHDFGERDRIFILAHESAGAGFHVEDQRVDAFGELFAHDGGADEADVLDGGGGVAQGVDFLVGGSDLGGLPDEGHAAFAKDALEIGESERGVEAGDGFELVERAASMAESAAADHRNGEAARGYDGRKDERSLVTYAAGGMLVHFFDGQVGVIDDFTGMQHGFGERGEFSAGQASNPGGHQPGGHLIIGNFVVGVGGNKEVDFLAGVFPGIPLFSDQVDGAHAIGIVCETNIGVVRRQRSARRDVWSVSNFRANRLSEP